MSDNNINVKSLPLTGERYLPEMQGNIELEHIHRYLFAKQLSFGKRVLDIASGEGYGSALLAQSAISVIGVDISPDAVAHANIKYQADNLEFKFGSCAAIPLTDHSVDVVVSFETIEHHDEHDAMMRDIKRVLAPGGLLIISSPDKLEYSDKTGYDNPYHVKELYREDFISLLETYFKNHKIAGQRIIYGSAIFEEDGLSNIRSYDLDDNSLLAAPGVRHALYLLAVASDAELPLTESCILEQPVSASDIAHDYIRQIAGLEASRSDLQQQLSALGSEHDKVVVWTKSLKQAVNDRDQQLAGLEASRSDLQQQLISMGHEHDQVVAWTQDLTKEIANLQAILAQHQSSLAWRFSARFMRLYNALTSKNSKG